MASVQTAPTPRGGHETTGGSAALPVVRAPMAPERVVSELTALAMRGQLAGFEVGNNGTLFRAAVHSHPFDHELRASADTRSGGSCTLRFGLRMARRVPIIAAGLIVLSIWPGMWITDSMMRTYFSWYRLSMCGTAAWYLPLTILPLPWVLGRQFVRARSAARTDARAIIDRIAATVGGTVAAERS